MPPEPTPQQERIIEGVKGFAADMRAQGIHVGLGSPPVCVCCGEAWPCSAERGETPQ